MKYLLILNKLKELNKQNEILSCAQRTTAYNSAGLATIIPVFFESPATYS